MQGWQVSQKVLAVVGRCCVSRSFREQFFENPRPVAQAFVGTMTESELEQIDDISGNGTLPPNVRREDFKPSADKAFDVVFSFYLCPTRPCPRGD